MNTIKIKYHTDIPKIEKISIGDWIDLRAAETVELTKGDLKYISLGVSVELPDRYEAYIAPRSSLPKAFGVICANSFGIIDNAFRGDNDVWKFCVYAIVRAGKDHMMVDADTLILFKYEGGVMNEDLYFGSCDGS